MQDFTKNIWMYWHQGFDKAPELVKNCVAQWRLLHPDWELKLLDKDTANDYLKTMPIDTAKLKELELPHYSDLIRTQLLINYGGVWADPTCFPLKSLESWLPSYFDSGLFLFYRPGRDRIISNWFIAARSQNKLLINLYEELCSYWNRHSFINRKNNYIWYEAIVTRILRYNTFMTRFWFTWLVQSVLKLYPYMVYHYMFNRLVKTDSACKKQWKAMPKYSAIGPHKLQRIGLLTPLDHAAKKFIDNKQEPLVKLTWKLNTKWQDNSVLDYLFNHNK